MKQPGLPALGASTPRSSRHPRIYLLTALVVLAAATLLALAGCATTDEQRFPLDYLSGIEASHRLETAREAFPAYLRMGTDLERRGQFKDAALAYNNAVTSAFALGRFQDALNASQKAVEMAERSGNPLHLSNALARLGWTYVNLGAFEKAIPVFERGALAGQRAHEPQVETANHNGLSRVYRQLGNREKALEYCKKSVEILATAITVKTAEWSRFGVQGRRWLANLDRSYADALTQLNPRPGFVAGTQGRLGGVYRGMGRLAEAEDAFRQAVAGFEDLRSLLQSEELRESFFEGKIGIYENLILCLLERGKGPEAFDISERARARAFLDLLGNRVTLSRGRSQSLVAEERELRERISALKALPEDSPALRRELELAREAYQAFLQRVRRLDREQASLMTVEPLTLPQVQALLPEGSVLLEYFVTGQGRTILWTVERDRIAVVSLPLGRGRVTQSVQAFRSLIAARDRQPDMQRMARALFDQLVRPGLQGRAPKELLIIPHDALHYLPFQALMPAPGRYLLQEVALHYYSSASLMQFTRAKGQAGAPTFFALGNPDFQDPTLSLRYAEREARGIAALFPETALVTGRAATKAASRDEIRRHSVLHFATHAEFDEADPLGSSLLLAGTPGEESRLEVQEIFGLDLHASLVVLSACETALGKLTRGDELTGLTRAFIYAGTPSVITTLWQVNDRAAFELMREFYRHLKAGEGKAEALRQAQLAMLQRHPRPYYWAAYQLIGEAR
jgi:CHAT domain-containing protein